MGVGRRRLPFDDGMAVRTKGVHHNLEGSGDWWVWRAGTIVGENGKRKRVGDARMMSGDSEICVRTPGNLVHQRIVKPRRPAKEGLCQELERLRRGGERAHDGEDAALSVEAVGHAFVWESTGRRTQAVETVERRRDSDRSAWYGR